MAEQPEDESNKKLLILAAAGVAVLIVVFVVTRSAKDPTTNNGNGSGATTSSSGMTTSSSTSSGATGSSSSGHRSSSSGNDPSGTSSSGNSPIPSVSGITSGNPVDMTQLLLEAKTVEAARTALASGDPKKALSELDFYFKIPNAQHLRQEATLLKIEALQQVGRKTDARALAMSTRDDPSFDTYQGRINDLLFPQDAGK